MTPGGRRWTNKPFSSCKFCPIPRGTTPGFCYRCLLANEEVDDMSGEHCPVCCRPLDSASDTCENPLCSTNEAERVFGKVMAATTRTGAIGKMISYLKPKDGQTPPKSHYAPVLGGFLSGWAVSNQEQLVGQYDLVMPMPAVPERVEEIGVNITETLVAYLRLSLGPDTLDYATSADEIATKQHRVEARTTGNSWQRRRAGVQGVYQVTPGGEDRLANAAVLIVDDVFVTGWNLNELAEQLLAAGASQVDGLVVARQIFDPTRSAEG
jgi:predicted amidophosphoribosyltransferase